jgi:hypothetical protein
VVFNLKARLRNGTTHLLMSPLEFVQRLATRVRRPRPAMSSPWFSPLKGCYRAPNHATCRAALGGQVFAGVIASP